jgi:hypothetical protein
MRPSKIIARHDFREAVRACLVCWDLLVSFYFYNGRHDMRCNGRILCARVAPAFDMYIWKIIAIVTITHDNIEQCCHVMHSGRYMMFFSQLTLVYSNNYSASWLASCMRSVERHDNRMDASPPAMKVLCFQITVVSEIVCLLLHVSVL